MERGLGNAAIAGVFRAKPLTPANFVPNQAFVRFLHDFLTRRLPEDEAFIGAAREQQDGYVYVIDLRTPEGPQGRVPVEDIVSAMEVRGGRLVPGSYQPNLHYAVYTAQGLLRLHTKLHDELVRELAALGPDATDGN